VSSRVRPGGPRSEDTVFVSSHSGERQFIERIEVPFASGEEVTILKEATIHIVDGKVDDIHFDGQEGVDIDAFLLVTHRRNVEEGHFLAYGNSDRVGKMLYNFYLNCLRNDYLELGETLEKVARDILDVARVARGRPWPQLTDRVEPVN
jgi:hypothetical protein